MFFYSALKVIVVQLQEWYLMHIVSGAFKTLYKISMDSNLKTRDSTRFAVLTTSAIHETS